MVTQNNKRKMIDFILGLVLAYYIFMPSLNAFIPWAKSSTVVVVINCILGIFVLCKKSNITVNSNFKIMMIFIMCSIYTLIITILNRYSMSFNTPGFIVPLKLIGVYLLANCYKIRGIYGKKAVNQLICISNIQGVICVLMYFFPSLKKIANQLYTFGILDYENNELAGITHNRIYGIFGDYTCSGPIFMAMIACVSFAFLINDKRVFYFLSFIIQFVSSLLNGRTGIIIMFVCIPIMLIYKYRFSIKIRTLIKILFLLIIMTLFVISEYEKIINNDKVIDAITIFSRILKKDQSLEYLKMIIVPNGINIVIGEGHRVYGSIGMETIGMMSDYGFINDLYRGGILYCVVYHGATIKMMLDYGKNSKMYRCISISMILFYLIGNIKGEISSASTVMCAICFIVFTTNSVRGGVINEFNKCCDVGV